MTEHDQDRAGRQADRELCLARDFHGLECNEDKGHIGWHVARGLTHAISCWPVAASRVTPEPAALRELRKLSEKATPGEWVRSKHCFQILTADSERSVTELSTPRGTRATNGEVEQWQENVKFIVACVNYVRAALSAEQPKSASGRTVNG